MRQDAAVCLAGLFAVSSVATATAQVAPQGGLDPTQQLRQEASSRETSRKQELADSVLAARQAAAGRAFSPRLRALLAAELMSLSLDGLEAFATAGGLGDIHAAAGDTRVTNVLGAAAADLLFTPVPPCRIINTTVTGGAIGANTKRSFFVNGTTGFDTQGGATAGCGIPDDATAVAMNLIAVGPTAAGDFRAFPYSASATAPNASIVNYASLPGLNIANGVVQPVCDAAATTCTFDLIVQADVAASHLIIDVLGYFRKFSDPNRAKAATVFTGLNANTPSTGAVVTVSSANLTVDGPGRIIAIGTADAFCDAGCAAGTDYVAGYLAISDAVPANLTGLAQAYFFTTTNQTNSITRTFQLDVTTAGPKTIYLLGKRETLAGGTGTQVGFYRGQLQVFFLPN
jgi:hypothetical protein